MVGLLTRLWGAIRSKQLVGVDKVGNSYYRQSRKIDGALVEKRWVEFKGDPNPTNVPVEWTSWLTGRRQQAPTKEEIRALEAHRKLVKMKAAIIEKEEEKRRFRLKTLQQDIGTDMTPQEMDKFIEQVAALEDVNFDGGEGSFANEIPSEPSSIQKSSRFSERLDQNCMPGEQTNTQDQNGIMQPKETTESWRWVPPN